MIVAQLHQIALGLVYLHSEGIVHGDLHAGNILIDETGGVRLADFGLSLLSEGTGYNYGSQHGGGAVHFTAPELFDPDAFGLKSSRPTFRSDIYALACVCIEVRLIGLSVILISNGEPSSTRGSLLLRTLLAIRSLCELYEATGHLDRLSRTVMLCPTPCGR